jgi:hypothetical protein
MIDPTPQAIVKRFKAAVPEYEVSQKEAIDPAGGLLETCAGYAVDIVESETSTPEGITAPSAEFHVMVHDRSMTLAPDKSGGHQIDTR